MRMGLHCNRFTYPSGDADIGRALADIARRADAAGFYSMWVMDHLFQIPPVGPAEMAMNEAYTTLGYIAAITKNLRLGTMVTGITYRHPGFLVKQVTTLDVLSGGRAYFGVGAAWFEREHHGLGIPFPPLSERFQKLEETLQIANQMWSGEVKPFHGKHYQLEETLTSPMPVQKPRPTILIGGGGETKTLKLVARYADACNLFAQLGNEALRHKLEVLAEHCRVEGRSYDAIEKTCNMRLEVTKDGANGSMSPAQTVDHFAILREIGFTHVNCSFQNMHEAGAFDLVASDVIPAIARL